MTLATTISSRSHDVVVEYNVIPASRGTRDSLGGIRGAGPPLEPDTPAEVEVLGVYDRVSGAIIDVDDEELDELTERCLEDYEEHQPDDSGDPD